MLWNDKAARDRMIVEALRSGGIPKRIACEFAISVSALARIAKREGVPLRARRATRGEIVAAAAGCDLEPKLIAAICGVTDYWVRKVLREEGFPMRPRGRPPKMRAAAGDAMPGAI